LALSTSGHVFSFGCNDEAALGRIGTENVAEPVIQLPMGITDIVTGDSHSIAYNTKENKSFYWGCYRNPKSGKTTPKVIYPEPFATSLFEDPKSKLRVKKIASGQHHTLLLTECGKMFGTGDNTCSQLGFLYERRSRHAKT